jgi:integrase
MPEVARGTETPTFLDYAEKWLQTRPLKPRTRAHYEQLLAVRLADFHDVRLGAISPALVRAWYAASGTSAPTARAHAYGLLRAILATAESDDLITHNPAHIRGAGNTKRVKKIRPASLDELERLVDAMPPKYRAMTLLASWCALRFGELAELRRGDIDLRHGVVHVRRAVVRVAGGYVVDRPKSDAGVRDVAIPPHLTPVLKDHLAWYVAPGKDSLLFPAADGVSHLAVSTLYRVFYPARLKAGRSDLRWHDLRHTGAVLAASTGATLAELMGRLGHSTPGAALRYQHAAEGRDAQIAKALSLLAHEAAEKSTAEPEQTR